MLRISSHAVVKIKMTGRIQETDSQPLSLVLKIPWDSVSSPSFDPSSEFETKYSEKNRTRLVVAIIL